jgi:hypothetical protein
MEKQEYGLGWDVAVNLCNGSSCFVGNPMHGFALNVNADLGYFDNITRAVFERQGGHNIKCES